MKVDQVTNCCKRPIAPWDYFEDGITSFIAKESSLKFDPKQSHSEIWCIVSTWSLTVCYCNLTFHLFIIVNFLYGRWIGAYTPPFSGTQWGNWYDNLLRAILRRDCLWWCTHFFCYINSCLLLIVYWMFMLKLDHIWGRKKSRSCWYGMI